MLVPDTHFIAVCNLELACVCVCCFFRCSQLMVTTGDDRMVKLWNLTKTCAPLKVIKRFLHTDVSWPVFWPGVFLTQESCYATLVFLLHRSLPLSDHVPRLVTVLTGFCSFYPRLGQQGLHYLDSGYFGYKPLFVCTRRATVWVRPRNTNRNKC